VFGINGKGPLGVSLRIGMIGFTIIHIMALND